MGRSINSALWEQWRARMVRYSESDLTVAEFCWSEDVSQASFYQWRRKLKNGPKGASDHRPREAASHWPASFVPVVPVDGGSAGDGSGRGDVVVLVLANGVRVEVPCSEPALVERVVRTASHDVAAAAEGQR